MMKPKRKTSSANPIARFWREFLFTREFEFETTLPLEQCVAALERLSGTVSLYWGHPDKRLITIKSVSDGSKYSFYAEHQRRGNKGGGYSTIIVVEGLLAGDNTHSLVIGTARFAGFFYIVFFITAVISLLAFLLVLKVTNSGLALLIFTGLAVWGWWETYHQRNAMIASLETLIRDAERMDYLVRTKPQDDNIQIQADNFTSQKSKH